MKTDTLDPTSLFADTPPPVPPVGTTPGEPTAATGAPVSEPTNGAPVAATITDATAVDGAGTPFDPIRHLPTKHPKTDRWMPRRQPRESANGSGPTDPLSSASFIGADDEPAPTPAGPSPSVGDVCTAMADLHCRAFYGLTAALLSDEWLPDKSEHAANRDVLAAYYRAKNMTPDSPGWALAAQLAAYGAKRFAMPKTQTRLGMLKAWIGAKIAGWRGARRAAAIQSATS